MESDAQIELQRLVSSVSDQLEQLPELRPSDWLTRVCAEFHLTDKPVSGGTAPYTLEDLEFAERVLANGLTAVGHIGANVGGSEFDAALPPECFQALHDALEQTSAADAQLIQITAGLKFCGTIDCLRIRVTIRGSASAAVCDFRPVDTVWESYWERFSVPGSDSPDGPLPQDDELLDDTQDS